MYASIASEGMFIIFHAATLGFCIINMHVTFLEGASASPCTQGFASIDRINAVQGIFGTDDLSLHLEGESIQVVVPAMNFMCSGSILSLGPGGRETLAHSLSYRYGDLAVKMDPILKLAVHVLQL